MPLDPFVGLPPALANLLRAGLAAPQDTPEIAALRGTLANQQADLNNQFLGPSGTFPLMEQNANADAARAASAYQSGLNAPGPAPVTAGDVTANLFGDIGSAVSRNPAFGERQQQTTQSGYMQRLDARKERLSALHEDYIKKAEIAHQMKLNDLALKYENQAQAVNRSQQSLDKLLQSEQEKQTNLYGHAITETGNILAAGVRAAGSGQTEQTSIKGFKPKEWMDAWESGRAAAIAAFTNKAIPDRVKAGITIMRDLTHRLGRQPGESLPAMQARVTSTIPGLNQPIFDTTSPEGSKEYLGYLYDNTTPEERRGLVAGMKGGPTLQGGTPAPKAPEPTASEIKLVPLKAAGYTQPVTPDVVKLAKTVVSLSKQIMERAKAIRGAGGQEELTNIGELRKKFKAAQDALKIHGFAAYPNSAEAIDTTQVQ